MYRFPCTGSKRLPSPAPSCSSRNLFPAALAGLLFLCAPLAAHASDDPGVGPTHRGLATADSILATLAGPGEPGVLAALVDEDGIRWSGAVGLANLSHGIPMTVETRINVGSTAKTLMGYALARLHLDGALSLDDDVRLHLPELPDLGSPVTLRHLLTHTSGYREFLNALAVGGWRLEDSDHVDAGEALRVVQRQPALQNEPGAEWNYNNTGYVILGHVVERVTGLPYTAWIEKEVFVPLGMTTSTFRLEPTRVITGAAYGYLPVATGDDGSAPAWREGRDVGAAIGAGALYTTLGDLARWMLALTGSDPRWAEPFRLMTDPFVLTDGTSTTYGLGIEIDRFAGLPRIHHPGGDIGHQSHFAWFPEAGKGVIVVSNRGNFPGSSAGALARALLSEHLDDASDAGAAAPVAAEPPVSTDGAFPAEFLARLVGRYEVVVQSGFVLSIRLEEGVLVAQGPGQPAFSLAATADTSFVAELVGARFTFELDEEGPASSLTLHQGGQAFAAIRLDEDPAATDLAPYAGYFHSDEFETAYTVVVDGGALVLEHRRRAPVRLEHASGDLFTGPFPFLRVSFERNDEGIVTGFLADAARARDIRFLRMR